MKKFHIIITLFLFAISANAQRIAVLEFNAGSGISQADVDGISAIFNTYFSPKGYTLVERSQIDRVIDEQRLQRSKLTQTDAVRIGQLLNVAKIVVGDVNVIANEYNLDVRIINVESGTIAAKDGITWIPGNTYRDMMKTLSTRLSSQITISSGQAISNNLTRQEVVILYDYLKVFPNELGEFEAEPKNVISVLNKSAKYGYNTWRIPTKEELALMRAENLLTSGKNYMSQEDPEGVVLLVTTGKDAATINAEIDAQIKAEIKAKELEEQKKIEQEEWERELVDLGLPSGTRWSRCYYYLSCDCEKASTDAATPEQWQELLDYCTWKWKRKEKEDHTGYYKTWGHYEIKGPNGNVIWIKNISDVYYESDDDHDSIKTYSAGRAGKGCNNNMILYYNGKFGVQYPSDGHPYYSFYDGFEGRWLYTVYKGSQIHGISFLCDWSGYETTYVRDGEIEKWVGSEACEYRFFISSEEQPKGFFRGGGFWQFHKSPCGETADRAYFRVIPVSKP